MWENHPTLDEVTLSFIGKLPHKFPPMAPRLNSSIQNNTPTYRIYGDIKFCCGTQVIRDWSHPGRWEAQFRAHSSASHLSLCLSVFLEHQTYTILFQIIYQFHPARLKKAKLSGAPEIIPGWHGTSKILAQKKQIVSATYLAKAKRAPLKYLGR